MKVINKILWYWKLFLGKKYYITYIEEGLEEDEILVIGHRIYILHKKSQKDVI